LPSMHKILDSIPTTKEGGGEGAEGGGERGVI
jgi:hypothetical protein